jgi:hypothetical protein
MESCYPVSWLFLQGKRLVFSAKILIANYEFLNLARAGHWELLDLAPGGRGFLW